MTVYEDGRLAIVAVRKDHRGPADASDVCLEVCGRVGIVGACVDRDSGSVNLDGECPLALPPRRTDRIGCSESGRFDKAVSEAVSAAILTYERAI